MGHASRSQRNARGALRGEGRPALSPPGAASGRCRDLGKRHLMAGCCTGVGIQPEQTNTASDETLIIKGNSNGSDSVFCAAKSNMSR